MIVSTRRRRPFQPFAKLHNAYFIIAGLFLFSTLVSGVTYYAPAGGAGAAAPPAPSLAAASVAAAALQTTTVTYHLHKEASSTSGHLQLKTAAVDSTSLAIQSADLKAGATGHKLVKSFNTASGVPNLPGTIPAGSTVSFTLWMKKSANYGTLYPRAQVGLNNSSGTRLCAAVGTTALTTALTKYTLTCQTTAAIAMKAADRFYLWTGVNLTAGNSANSFKAELRIEGTAGGNYDSLVVIAKPTPTALPTVSITAPANNASVAAGSTMTISAAAADSDGTIAKVEFYRGATKLGEDTSAPYSYTWTNAAAGSYQLTATATDNLGAKTTSSAVNINVSAPSGPTNGLVGYWKMDEASGTVTTDWSGNSNTGTLQGGATWASGKTGSAVGFDGADDYVQIGAKPNLVMTNTMSVAAWIRPTGAGTGVGGGIIINKEGEYEIARFPDGTIQWAVANSNPGWTWINTGYVAPLNQWTHIAFVYENGIVRTYANGQFIHIYSGAGTIGDVAPTLNEFWIGERSARGQCFQGQLDEVRIYNQALTAQDVATIAGTSVGGSGGGGLSRARLSPKNATGGTNLYSGNFGWGTGLVNLPGRNGLDASLSLAYNSLVWTRDGNQMYFDLDAGNVSPGFRLGYPVIEPSYPDALTGKQTFLMVNSSGGRSEFRQTGATNFYDAPDSSFAQLEVLTGANAGQLIVRATDGTQMRYQLISGLYRCTEIKDSNGNFLTNAYNQDGKLTTITDTLGRVLTINYDVNSNPRSIVQTWGTGTHTWATFGYANTTINYNFGALGVQGIINNSSIPVLARVTFADGGYYKFDYNSYGQVRQINRYAADNHKLNHIALNLPPDAGVQQTDCPRFTEIRNWAENWNNNQEAVTQTIRQDDKSFRFEGDMLIIGTLLQTTTPDGVVEKTYLNTTGDGWEESLPMRTETWANDGAGLVRKRWSETRWTQDNEFLAYLQNPRVIRTSVGDSTNVRKTEIEYYPQYNWVKNVREYDADETTVLRRTFRNYYSQPEFVSRRLIGLTATEQVFEGESTLVSQITYGYDEDMFNQPGTNIAPVQHDNTNYGAGFKTGRGNLTTAHRWDVTAPSDSSRVKSQVLRHDTTGNVVATWTSGDATTVNYDYTDSFSDGVSRNTFAYLTKVTDQAGYLSTVQYRYDIGANVRAQSPAPAGQSIGKVTTRSFDAVGRLERETIQNTGAYTRYEYPLSQGYVATYSTITDTNGNGADAADETQTITYFDGAGRTISTQTRLPDGADKWRAESFVYDTMGRLASQMRPVEINSAWQVTGDDVGASLWSSQTYDWKGRPLVKTNTDGSNIIYEYDGCGCAGGEVTTIRGEQLAEGRRTQKIYKDVLGRAYKTEILNWDSSVYSSTVTKLNARDQALWTKEYVGAAPSNALSDEYCPVGSCQLSTTTYDGHARPATVHVPQQNAGASTVYEYYANDQVKKVTDARGASSTFTYNSRGLTERIDYYLPAGLDSAAAAQASWPSPVVPNRPRDCEDVTSRRCYDEPPPPPPTRSPRGYLDSVSSTGVVSGWSYDPDNSSASNTVHFYLDGPAGGGGTYIGQATTDQLRSDVNSNYGISGNHGYQFQIPSQYLTGQHTIYAYGIDISGGNSNTLLTNSPKTYNPPPQPTITAVTFEYDALGNRTAMTDTMGRVDYAYDQLSRLQSESRDLTAVNNPLAGDGRFTLSYEYTLAGGLNKITDPYGASVNYSYDKTGRMLSVTGSVYGGVTDYASELEYRAWGTAKHMRYGDNTSVDMTYNNRLSVSKYDLKNISGTTLMGAEYQYYNDGQLRFVDDLRESRFDRLFAYDHVGRVTTAVSGYLARNEAYPGNNTQNGPYNHYYGYDAFGNLTSRTGNYWYAPNGESFTATYQNNRNQNAGWQYDADGRVTRAQTTGSGSGTATTYTDSYKYNAAGHQVEGRVDGEGRQIKSKDGWYYYIRSSALGGQVVSEVWSEAYQANNLAGKKARTYVFAGSQVIAEQSLTNPTTAPTEVIIWKKRDPKRTSVYTGSEQQAVDLQGIATTPPDYASLQQNQSYYNQSYGSYNYYNWAAYNQAQPYSSSAYGYGSSGATGGVPGNFGTGCTYDGAAAPCGSISSHAVKQCPNNDCGPRNINGKLVPIRYAGDKWVDASTGQALNSTLTGYARTKPVLKTPTAEEKRAAKARAAAAGFPADEGDEYHDYGGYDYWAGIGEQVREAVIDNAIVYQDLFDPDILDGVKKRLRKLFTKKCHNAFRQASYNGQNLKAPGQALFDGEIIIAPREAIKYNDRLLSLGMTEASFSTLRNTASHRFTYPNPPNSFDGRRIIFIGSDAFTQEGGSVIAHETIHGIGVPTNVSWEPNSWEQEIWEKWGGWHDLTRYKPHYENIIKDCGL